MTKDQIIAMAREAGFLYFNSGKFSEHGAIMHFASLVAAQAAAEEREECAKLSKEVFDYGYSGLLIAASIRNRESP